MPKNEQPQASYSNEEMMNMLGSGGAPSAEPSVVQSEAQAPKTAHVPGDGQRATVPAKSLGEFVKQALWSGPQYVPGREPIDGPGALALTPALSPVNAATVGIGQNIVGAGKSVLPKVIHGGSELAKWLVLGKLLKRE